MSDQNSVQSWAKLRQVVLATTEHASDLETIQRAFGLGAGFGDPELKKWALLDATMPVSDERYLEFVGPEDDSTPVSAWLAKIGGRGGYVLSVQHPDLDAVRERAKKLGVAIPVDIEVLGKRIIQLHPKDVGVLLEVDGIDDPEEWFWDDINPGPELGAGVSDIVGVEVEVADPTAMTALWHDLLGLGDPVTANTVELGGAYVQFTEGGPSADWTVVLRESDAQTAVPELPGVHFRLV